MTHAAALVIRPSPCAALLPSGAPFRFLFFLLKKDSLKPYMYFNFVPTPTWSKFVRWTHQRVGSKALSCVHLEYECILWISSMCTTRVHLRLGFRGGRVMKMQKIHQVDGAPLCGVIEYLSDENANVWDRKPWAV